MKSVIKKTVYCVKKLLDFVFFLILILAKGRYKHVLRLSKYKKNRIAIIATGPSLKEDVHFILDEDYKKQTDFLMLNFSAFDSLFFKLRPQHYCLADPMFFQSSWRDEEVFRFFYLLNSQVEWDMTIYVPAQNLKQFIKFSRLDNSNIKVLGVNIVVYNGFEKFRNLFYRVGLSSPPPRTVANLAIFVGINTGYQNIDLFGVDHTFFSALMVNEKNQLCQIYSHSYDEGEVEYKVVTRTDNNKVWKVGEYITACGNMFLSHDLLENYAKSIDCRIINNTKCSMIDSYERKNR